MKLEAIKLCFLGPVHLGRGSEELDRSEIVYHSDSLKSAIYAVGLSYFPEWQNEQFFFNGFFISSCFPYAFNEYFLPKPFIKTNFLFSKIHEDKSAKKGKKIEFLSRKVFENFVNTTTGSIEVNEDNITPDGMFICEEKQNAEKSFFRNEIQQRVLIPFEDEDEETRPFFTDRLYFHENCGLYFLADFKENELLKSQVLQTLKLLGECGIGTDRTVGNGLFEFNVSRDLESIAFHFNKERKRQVNMGLYWPNQDEYNSIDFNNSFWQIVKRGGYIAGTFNDEFLSLRKKSVFMFMEGSLFDASKELKGTYDDLKPQWDKPLHSIWRDGQCLFFNI